MITIYYTNFINQFEFQEPVNIVQNYCKKNDKLLTKCPAWLELNKNTFGIKSSQSFTMSLKDGKYHTDQPQDWFDNNIQIRDENNFSFAKETYFFTLEKSLLLEQKTPVLENNDIKNKTMSVEGIFDIGKWVRPLECSVVMHKNDTLNIEEDDIIYYVKFHTKEKIKFRKFLATNKLYELLSMCARTRKTNITKTKSLNYFYNLLNAQKYKKIVFNEIKKNLI